MTEFLYGLAWGCFIQFAIAWIYMLTRIEDQ